MWFKHIFFCAIILFSLYSQAVEIDLWPLIVEGRGERNDNQDLELRTNQLPSLGATVRFDRWAISVDSSQFQHSTSDGNVSIKTQYQDFAVWGGYSLFQDQLWNVYAVAGMGMYQQQVKTTVSDVSTTNTSSNKSLVGGGAEFALHLPAHLSAAAGVRLDWTEDLEPEFMPVLYLKLGAWF
jgi:hypothetical protein